MLDVSTVHAAHLEYLGHVFTTLLNDSSQARKQLTSQEQLRAERLMYFFKADFYPVIYRSTINRLNIRKHISVFT